MYNPYPIIKEQHRDVAAVALVVRRFIEFTLEWTGGWIGLSTMQYNAAPHTSWAQSHESEVLTNLAIQAALKNVHMQHGIHLNMAPRRGRPASGRGSDADVLHFPCLWADIDDDTDDTLRDLRAFKPSPALIAFSGGGYHAYWPLLVPAPNDSVSARVLQSLVNQFQHGDPAASRPHAMMRVPGSVNTKPSRGNIVEALEWNTDTIYRFEDFVWLDPGPEVLRPKPARVDLDDTAKRAVTAEEVAMMCHNAESYRDGWRASCPVPSHGKGKGDKTPSLTIRQGDRGVLLYCHAQCALEDIVRALDLKMGDLFSQDSRPATRAEMRTMALWRDD